MFTYAPLIQKKVGSKMKIPDGLETWTPDEVAECMDGISTEIYRRLWELLETIPAMPVGGDGSYGTVEVPPEPDAYLECKMGAIWNKLTPDEQEHISKCYLNYEENLREFRARHGI